MRMDSSNLISEIQSFIKNEDFADILDTTKDRDVVMFLGNNKAGKTTIVHYLMGKTLVGVPINKRKFRIEVRQHSEAAGSNTIEKLSFRISQLPNSSTVLVDTPGFSDNNSAAQDVANAFFVREILSSAKSAKLVIVSDIHDITNDNINYFLSLMERIHSMQVGDFREGMLIAFTKDDEGYSVNDLCVVLKDKILNEHAIKVNGRDLIQYFVDNKKHIKIIKMIDNDGLVHEDLFGDLQVAIKLHLQATSKKYLAKVTLGMSDNSRSALLNERLNKLQHFADKLQLAEKAFKNNTSTLKASTLEGQEKNLGHLQYISNQVQTLQESITKDARVEETLEKLIDIVPAANSLYELRNIAGDISATVAHINDLLKMPSEYSLLEKVKDSISNMQDTKWSACKIMP